jgi:hypothetical protein
MLITRQDMSPTIKPAAVSAAYSMYLAATICRLDTGIVTARLFHRDLLSEVKHSITTAAHVNGVIISITVEYNVNENPK